MGRPDGPRALAIAGADEPGALAAAPLRALRDAVLSGEPGCAGNPELFTGPAGIEPDDEPPEDRAARADAAWEICAACPVRMPCLAWALRTLPAAGIWAGLLPEEIAALAAAPRNLRWRPAGPAAEPGALGEVA